MVDASVKSNYLSGIKSGDKAYINKIGRWIDEGVAIFDSLGVTEPQAADYERLRAEITERPGKRGKPKSAGVIRDFVNAVKGYYEKKAGRMQMTIAPEAVQVTVEHEPLCEAPMADVQEAGEASKPKRGRKPKPENADRVQVSVYLPRETYEGVRDLAANSGQGISDILARLAFFFTESNAEALARIREVRGLTLTYEL